ncbi:MAG: SLC13 family permease [Dermatophilus congolensis]|nr:SLC13 family permease [Dermatophilus congolensis]
MSAPAETTITRWATTPPRARAEQPARPHPLRRLPWAATIAGALLVTFIAWCGANALGPGATLPAHGALTLAVFALAIWLWIFSSIGDTYVALGAAVVLVVMGVLPDELLFTSLGEDTVWLLLAAFVIAAGITASGLSTRAAAFIVTGARSVRQLAHLTTATLVATAFAVPSTSGRAALAVPVFVALATVFAHRRRLVLALALLFPSVILLSAVASLLGAGAHLITSQILTTAGYDGFSFARWLLLGLPLALVASHLCTEIILLMFTTREDRREPVAVTLEEMARHAPVPITGPLTVAQSRSALLIAAVVTLWCTEPLHGLHPAVVALLGSLVVASPRFGSVGLGKALKAVPWSMLMFMAATLTLGSALVDSGAAEWLAGRVLAPVAAAGTAAGWVFVVVVVLVSTAAHLVIQSRSARSAVLVPIVVSLAPGVGVDPIAAAFASTAAAGFCHTLTSSAKPVTLFSDLEGTPGVENIESYEPRHLLRLSAVLAPVSAVLVLVFAAVVWPAMGMPLFR